MDFSEKPTKRARHCAILRDGAADSLEALIVATVARLTVSGALERAAADIVQVPEETCVIISSQSKKK